MTKARPVLTFWFEFASTYSYLSALRIAPLARAAGVELVWQPFLLGPIFKAQGWDTSPFSIYPAKGRYMWRDLARRCAELGLPQLHRPDPFPQNGLLAARIATYGQGADWGPEFVRAVYRAEFAEGRQISELDVLTRILNELGLDPEETRAAAQSDPVKSRLRAATDAAQTRGLFGAPSFTTSDGELFWGDDRLEAALEWAARPQS